MRYCREYIVEEHYGDRFTVFKDMMASGRCIKVSIFMNYAECDHGTIVEPITIEDDELRISTKLLQILDYSDLVTLREIVASVDKERERKRLPYTTQESAPVSESSFSLEVTPAKIVCRRADDEPTCTRTDSWSRTKKDNE